MLAHVLFGSKSYVETVDQVETLTRAQLHGLTSRAINGFLNQFTDELYQLTLKRSEEIERRSKLAKKALEKSEECKMMAARASDGDDELQKRIQDCVQEILDIFKRNEYLEGIISDLSSQMYDVTSALNELRELSEKAIAVIKDQSNDSVTFSQGTYQFSARGKMITLKLTSNQDGSPQRFEPRVFLLDKKG